MSKPLIDKFREIVILLPEKFCLHPRDKSPIALVYLRSQDLFKRLG